MTALQHRVGAFVFVFALMIQDGGRGATAVGGIVQPAGLATPIVTITTVRAQVNLFLLGIPLTLISGGL